MKAIFQGYSIHMFQVLYLQAVKIFFFFAGQDIWFEEQEGK